jgi:hypothetical protein
MISYQADVILKVHSLQKPGLDIGTALHIDGADMYHAICLYGVIADSTATQPINLI